MSPLFHVELSELPYLAPYFISIVVALVIMGYLYNRRHIPVAQLYLIVMIFETVTTLAYVFEISGEMIPAKVFWDDVQWFTLFGEGITLVIFALHFTQRQPKSTAGLAGLLSILPAFFLASLLVPDLLPARSNIRLIEAEPLNALIYDFTISSYLLGFYLLGLGIATVVLLAMRVFTADPIYRGQIATVMLGVALPTVVGFLALADIQLTLQRDITPISFMFSNLIVTYGLMRYRLFDVAPIARQTVFDNMAEPVIVLDSALRVVDFNPAARQMFDPSRIAGIGKPATEVFWEWKGQFESLRDTLSPVVVPLETNINGLRLVWSVSVSPIVTRDHVPLGRVIILRDVTEQTLAREALEAQARDLEAARAAAEKANLVKSQFLASMSHELRTPLNGIINFNEAVLRGLTGPVSPEAAELLTKARNSSLHLLDLINDVLDISKMQAGALTLSLESIEDLLAEIERVADLARPMLRDKPVEFHIDCDQHFPALTCDRRRLRQVLLNLLSNAAKFTREGHITLRAHTEAGGLCCEVIDTGPGIPPEHQQAIFEPFVQTEDGRKQIEGTGLGLAISRHLAEAHGGSLTVQSEPGKGAHFTLRMPFQVRE